MTYEAFCSVWTHTYGSVVPWMWSHREDEPDVFHTVCTTRKTYNCIPYYSTVLCRWRCLKSQRGSFSSTPGGSSLQRICHRPSILRSISLQESMRGRFRAARNVFKSGWSFCLFSVGVFNSSLTVPHSASSVSILVEASSPLFFLAIAQIMKICMTSCTDHAHMLIDCRLRYLPERFFKLHNSLHQDGLRQVHTSGSDEN